MFNDRVIIGDDATQNKHLLMGIALVATVALSLSIPVCIDQILRQRQVKDFGQLQSFGFVLKYGVTARNELDTFNGTFTHDMVIDPSITINLTLTGDEMEHIYLKMVGVNFFNYAQKDANAKKDVGVTPYSSYYLKVKCDSTVKELTWDDNSAASLGFKTLVDLIIETIHDHEEFKQLPPPRGGYL